MKDDTSPALVRHRELRIRSSDGQTLVGDLELPERARGIVVFAHGSGSNRHSPRNRFVAKRLRDVGLGTLLVDLLTASEARTREPEDLEQLAVRLVEVTRFLEQADETTELPVAYFGASTGAAVALMAAASHPEGVVAVMSRGGRPDLVPADILAHVQAPTLFVVGSLDVDVLALNRRAMRRMRCDCRIEVVAGASHLFEEPGTLEAVAEHAITFYMHRLSKQELDTRLIADAEDPEVEMREDGMGTYRIEGYAQYRDRRHGGAELARALEPHRGSHPLVLGVPRGGIPVAAEVARRLDAELDVIVARKLGAPGHEELAIGAVTADGTTYINEMLLGYLGVSGSYLERVIAEQSAEARRRERRFRPDLPPLDVTGRTVIVVDDGIATGATLRAVARALRQRRVGTLVIAAPVGSADSCRELRHEADAVVCPRQPEPFYAVGLHYERFGQTSDEEVDRVLAEARASTTRVLEQQASQMH